MSNMTAADYQALRIADPEAYAAIELAAVGSQKCHGNAGAADVIKGAHKKHQWTWQPTGKQYICQGR